MLLLVLQREPRTLHGPSACVCAFVRRIFPVIQATLVVYPEGQGELREAAVRAFIHIPHLRRLARDFAPSAVLRPFDLVHFVTAHRACSPQFRHTPTPKSRRPYLDWKPEGWYYLRLDHQDLERRGTTPEGLGPPEVAHQLMPPRILQIGIQSLHL